MIGFLKGVVENKDNLSILLEVGGVGYRVIASSQISKKAEIGKPLKIYTYTHVKEDALELYGFLSTSDLRLFELLISVSGVGPKTALGIFSVGGAEQIIHAIIEAQLDFFTNVPRLGRKNAQKIIIELKNKLGGIVDLDLNSTEANEVVSALKSFGFTTSEIQNALRKIQQGLTAAETIKQALKYLGK